MNYQRLYEYRFRDIDQTTRAEAWVEIAKHVHEELGRPERVLDPAAGSRTRSGRPSSSWTCLAISTQASARVVWSMSRKRYS